MAGYGHATSLEAKGCGGIHVRRVSGGGLAASVADRSDALVADYWD